MDPSAFEDRWRAAQPALLLLGRVDAGVLTAEDVAAVLPLLRSSLGAPLLEQLRGLWVAAIGVADDGVALLDLAAQWVGLRAL